MPRKKKKASSKKGGSAAPPATPENAAADEQKGKGNQAFVRGDHAHAVTCFSKAIALSPDHPQVHMFFGNRSAAQCKLGEFAEAIRDANSAIAAKPTWSKGYSRLGAALFRSGDKTGALKAYVTGLAADPTSLSLAEELVKTQRVMQGLPAVATARRGQTATKAEPAGPAPNTGENTVIGIDLGTTYSCVAVWRNGHADVIPDMDGHRTNPSIVGFCEDGSRLVGHPAAEQAESNALNTVFDAKRLIGRSFSDTQTQSDVKHFPFEVIGGGTSGDDPMIVVDYMGARKQFAPEQISAIVLGRMKQISETTLGHAVNKAVVTVPAYFNDAQRNATVSAGRIAGLEVKRIINEPTAAALAYGLDRLRAAAAGEADAATGPQSILVFDLGGGTFDVSLLHIEESVFEVKATGGDTHLGGEDFDSAIVDHILKQLRGKQGKGAVEAIGECKRSMRRMRSAAEKAKRMLSATTTATIDLEGLAGGEIDVNINISRAKFESVAESLFARCLATVKQVLRDAKVTTGDVSDIVLVGGSTRIPRVQEMLSEFFGGKELCKSINPDEAVACGAAVQGAILAGVRDETTSELLLIDVAPLSLGIELMGQVMSTLIPRNAPIPCKITKTYTTEEDFQDSVDICVFEGERSHTAGNNKLGEFKITGIERAKRGEPKIAVTFELDSNGMLHVAATDEVTGAHNSVQIKNERGRLSQDDIDRMVADAAKFAAQDQARLESVEAKQQFEVLIDAVLDAGARSKRNRTELLAEGNTAKDWLAAHAFARAIEYRERQSDLEATFARLT